MIFSFMIQWVIRRQQIEEFWSYLDILYNSRQNECLYRLYNEAEMHFWRKIWSVIEGNQVDRGL